MDFWHENQGQTPLYSRFGTVPGRNCANNYNDRHQATYHPLYYSVQPDQGRESSHWTVPGSRTGGGPHDYTNWTDQDLTSLTSSQFPFVLDHHPQPHQEMGEYQLHEARGREWAAAQRAAREYDRGYPREGWQRRWELCSPIRHNREVSTKRSDNSYRELEAWAARYSHSLPRRKRIEAELRGASQGFLESRDSSSSRSGTDPRVAALQQVMQSANIREPWDRGGRPKSLTHYLSQTPSRETSHMLDMKEKMSYQRRMFSQPPGYIAPPPYNSPHKRSSVLHQCDTSLEKDGKRQSYWSQPTLQQQDVSLDLLSQRKAEKEDFKLTDGNLKTYLELEGLKQRQQETDAVQGSSPESTTNTQPEVLVPQQPQVLQAVQDKKINENSLLKVIEGRKFRLNKNTGGMTIFCLVSRIAGTSETPTLPLCTSHRDTRNTGSGGVTTEESDNKLFDEVDFRAPPLREHPNTSDSRSLQAKQKETPTCVDKKMLEDNLSKKPETKSVDTNYGESSSGRQSVQPATVKYPLWREPSLTSRADSERPSSCSKVITKDTKSDVSQNQEDSGTVHPIDIEVRRLDITKATESEDSDDLLVIDTTCVLVKMELIPSPKKEHVHYLHSTPNTEDSPPDIPHTVSPEVVQPNGLVTQEATADSSAQTNPWQSSKDLETQPKTDRKEELEPEVETEISLPYMSSVVSERETLAKRAERILGIPLQDCISDQQPEAVSLGFDLFLENQVVDPSLSQDNNSCEADQQVKDNTQDQERSQNQTEVSQTENAECLQEIDSDARDKEAVRSDQDFAVSQDQVPYTFEKNDVVTPLKTDVKCSSENATTEDPVLGSTNEEGTTEQNHDENQPDEKDTLPQKSAENQAPSPGVSSLTDTPSQQLPPPLLPASFSSTLQTDQSPSPQSFDSFDQTAGVLPSVSEEQDEMVAILQQTHDELCDKHDKDMTDEWVSEGRFEPDDASSLKEIDATDDQPTDVINPVSDIKDDAREFNICQQQHEGVQAEDVSCIKEGYLTEEQPPKEVNEDLTDHMKEETSKEYAMQVNSLEQRTECVQTGSVAWAKDSYMPEEHQIQEVTEDLTALLHKTISTDVITDSQTHSETKIVQDTEPNASPPSPHFDACSSHLNLSELPSLPDASNKPDEELVPHLEMDSVGPFSLSPTVDVAPAEGIPEMQLDSCEDYLQLPSSPDLPPVLPASSSPSLPHEGCESSSPDFTLKEEPQYPRSLWDAVNRIRKHTAPDSENEEEEVSELWDPESTGEDRAEIMRAQNIIFGEAGQQVSAEASVGEAEEGHTKKCPETCGHAEEDTFSCSSSSSHSSGDTVTEADEEEKEELEELQHDAGTEINQQDYEKFLKAEEE